VEDDDDKEGGPGRGRVGAKRDTDHNAVVSLLSKSRRTSGR
jgi:hypothetical protein